MFKKMFSRMSNKTRIALVGMLLYIFVPTDLIPDVIPGFGQVDDMAVIMYVVKCLYSDLRVKKRERKLVKG
ncbi:YkvA family protein [[Brevibacterium] frigoritolerans]|nr:YkvA family protein [Peribacillus frigoritolerans]